MKTKIEIGQLVRSGDDKATFVKLMRVHRVEGGMAMLVAASNPSVNEYGWDLLRNVQPVPRLSDAEFAAVIARHQASR